jgi:hypothetical protein
VPEHTGARAGAATTVVTKSIFLCFPTPAYVKTTPSSILEMAGKSIAVCTLSDLFITLAQSADEIEVTWYCQISAHIPGFKSL